ncbi:MAG: Maf family nucleotide pyrophosphatase, partial [Chitinophagaceae bacterium]|nr:Maf family nucleotide pyrophosphatase [Chitinophagaceae bacterium]
MHKIILASQSPRRRQLLEWAEIPFEVIVKHSSEDYPAQMPVDEVPEYLAIEKAKLVHQSLQAQVEGRTDYSATLPVVAADTVVILQQKIIGKPENREQAISYLTKLAGHTHRVVTGVAILHQDKQISFSETTHVTFHPLTPDQIGYYVDRYQPYDKAGGYAIQEWIGVIGIKKIEGDFYNVMGLPVS